MTEKQNFFKFKDGKPVGAVIYSDREIMAAKRFTVDSDGKYWDTVSNKYVTIDHLFYLVEKLEKENEQLKQSQASMLRELLTYRRIASCSNCKYQNYDWFEDGDEFEICEKGNSNQQIAYHICKEWEELE